MIYIRNPTYLPDEGRTQRAAFDFRQRRCGQLISRRGLGFNCLWISGCLQRLGTRRRWPVGRDVHPHTHTWAAAH